MATSPMSVRVEAQRLAARGIDFRTIDAHLRCKLGRDLNASEERDVLDAWRETADERDLVDARRAIRIANEVRAMRAGAAA